MYQETLDEIHEVKTIASHITGLGKILNITEDPTLQQLIDRVIKMLQKVHADPSVKGKSALPLFLQHLDHARKILPTVPRNAVRRVDGAGHAAQRGAGFHGGCVFLG